MNARTNQEVCSHLMYMLLWLAAQWKDYQHSEQGLDRAQKVCSDAQIIQAVKEWINYVIFIIIEW